MERTDCNAERRAESGERSWPASIFFLLSTLFLLLSSPGGAFGATGITPPEATGGGGTNIMSTTNGILNLATNGVKVSGVGTQLNLVAGNNIFLRGTNASDKVSIAVNLASNISLWASGSEMVLGTWGTRAGFSNATLAEMSLWIDDPSSDTEWSVGGNLIVGGIVQATNVTLTAIPGTGTNVGITAGGTLFRTTVSGGSGSAGTNIPVGQVLYLDAAFGDDSTASRTNLLRPYLTASNATAAMLSGDTLVVRGGTYLVNPKAASATSFSDGQNESGGLAITNRSNIRIVGEPGSIWQMSGFYSNSSTYSQPMLNLTRVTNAIIEGLTMRGIKTNAQVLQDYAVLLTDCDNITFQNCRIINWNNQGITDLSQVSINRNLFCYDTEFRDTGGTNCITLGNDGTAWSAIATNIIMRNNRFFYNLRNFEECCNGDARGLIYEGNYSIGCYGSEILMIATNNSEMKFINNISIGYATNEQLGGVSWMTIRAASNMVVQGNQVQGFGGKAVTYDTLAGARFVDVQFLDNTFHDFTDVPLFLYVPVGNTANFERISIMRNKFKNLTSAAIQMNANNSRIENNEFADCNKNPWPQGIVTLGYSSASVSTNATNITVIGNKFYAGQSSLVSTAIVIYGMSYSNAVWGNEIARVYQGGVHDLGVGTLKMPLNQIGPGRMVYSDTNSRLAEVTMGTGVAFNGVTGTLTASGSGSGTPGGDNRSGQYNSSGSFAGTDFWQYDPVSFFVEFLGPTLSMNNATLTNFMEPGGFGALGPHGVVIYTSNGVARWSFTTHGNLVPAISNMVDVGSFTKPIRTNYFQTVQMTPNAQRNRTMRSDGSGVGSWAPNPAGGNGNTDGGPAPPPGGVQFAQTNGVDGMMLDSTNEFVYTNRTLYAPTIITPTMSVSTLNISVLTMPTNGIPAAGNSGAVEFNHGGVLAGTNDLRFNRTNLTLRLHNGVDEIGVTVHQHGLYQSSAVEPLALGFSGLTNAWTITPTGTDYGSLVPAGSNLQSIGLSSKPISNLWARQIIYSMPTINVGAVNSNQTVSVGSIGTVKMYLTNAATFTNFGTLTASESATYLALITVVASTNVNVNWGLGRGYGVRVMTNSNNPIWTALTNGQDYAASWTGEGTNLHLRLSLEQ